jgi:hypothetical protein
VSKVFRYKSDARIRGEKTEKAIKLGLLSPDRESTLQELLLKYGRDITPTKHGAPQKFQVHKLCQHRIADLQSSHIAQFRDK